MSQQIPQTDAPRTRQVGLTLIEIMIGLTISVILAAIAVPSFDSFISNNQIRVHVRDVSSALSAARSEAVARGTVVSVCGSDNDSSCNGSNDWSGGLLVFVDDGAGSGTANDGSYGGSEEIISRYQQSNDNSLLVKDASGNAMTAISFDARGTIRQDKSGTLHICNDSNDLEYARAILLERSGRVSRSFDLHDSGGASNPDGIYEDVNGANLTCP